MENRTNELLKEINFKDLFKNCPKCNYNCEKEKAKSELRGRLDALKEEVKFIKSLDGLNKACWNLGNWNIIKTRLASIQEEIKLIEKAI